MLRTTSISVACLLLHYLRFLHNASSSLDMLIRPQHSSSTQEQARRHCGTRQPSLIPCFYRANIVRWAVGPLLLSSKCYRICNQVYQNRPIRMARIRLQLVDIGTSKNVTLCSVGLLLSSFEVAIYRWFERTVVDGDGHRFYNGKMKW